MLIKLRSYYVYIYIYIKLIICIDNFKKYLRYIFFEHIVKSYVCFFLEPSSLGRRGSPPVIIKFIWS